MPAPSDFNLAIKSVSHRHKAEHTNQRNRTESPEISVHTHCQVIFTSGAETTQRGRTVFSATGAGAAQGLRAALCGEKERKKTLTPLPCTTHKT